MDEARRKKRAGRRCRGRNTMTSTRRAAGTSCLTLAAAFSRAGREISDMRTPAPSLANRMHVSRPMPLRGDISTKEGALRVKNKRLNPPHPQSTRMRQKDGAVKGKRGIHTQLRR